MDLILLCLLLYGFCNWRPKPSKPKWMKNRKRANLAYEQYRYRELRKQDVDGS